jgi:hypothetical protein
VLPTVPKVINGHETVFFSVSKGGASSLVPIIGGFSEGKIPVGKGLILPKELVISMEGPYAPFFLNDGSALICRQIIKGAASEHLTVIGTKQGDISTKRIVDYDYAAPKRIVDYDYAAPLSSSGIVLLGARSLAVTSPKQLKSFFGSKCTLIYRRTDDGIYPLVSEYLPLATWSDNRIATVAPDQKSFELFEKKDTRWERLSITRAPNILAHVTWGVHKPIAAATQENLIQFYDLEKGSVGGKITCHNLSSKRVFIEKDSLLVCGIDSVCPFIAIIGCADCNKPRLLAEIPLGEITCDVQNSPLITDLVALKNLIIVKTNTSKSYAVGPISFCEPVKQYLQEHAISASGK